MLPNSQKNQSAANNSDCRKEVEMQNKITICYERLSKEDSRADESLSIENQKKLLETYAVQNGFTPFLHLTDDGLTGSNFNRPGWQELIAKVESGEVGTILLKTLDRMGRDYLRAGLYREMFREKGIRLIAVGDSFDSDKGEDDFTPFREIIAEWFVRDTSRKIRAINSAKIAEGKHVTGAVPYGYLHDPADRQKWIIDTEAEPIVKRIYQMTIDGKGITQIAETLSAERVLI
ncbi:hypothetical protein AGMMS49975_27480 [Clostridia bacterium]|nr:hypothetical protein AGMMS49975_27480 [Clostridia bacterium]